MSQGTVADRYAQALFELGEESGQLAVLSSKLREFSLTYDGSIELRAALTSPVLSSDERRALLTGVAEKVGVPPVGVQGLLVIAARGRLSALPAIVQRLSDLADLKDGVVRASIITATEMPESYYQSLSSSLSTATKKRIVLERSVDADLIGGAITRLGDKLIDGSVRGKLQRMERELLAAVASSAS